MKSLTNTYFGPISWYKLLACAEGSVYIEAHEKFIKQTERSRCRIMTANGVQTLSVPVSCKEGNIRSIRISDHDNWRKLHWQALCSAYGNSPFFEFYADDIKPFFEPNWEFLFDYDISIINKVCELLDIHPDIKLTKEYNRDSETCINEKTVSYSISDREQPPYYQVFQSRFGFVPNLSILDLLFNMGPESIVYLMK